MVEISISSIIGDSLDKMQHAIPQFSFPAVAELGATTLLLSAAIIIFLGVVGEAFFRKTGMPDIAFLMVLGVIIGPVFGVIPQDVIVQIVPYFAAVALIIIMFDGGLSLDIRKVIKTAHFALALSILGFAVSVASVAIVAYYGLGWSLIESVLLGTIVGGSSSVIVFGLVKQLNVSEETKSMLSLDSAITDILVTVIAFVLIDVLVAGYLNQDLAIERFAKSVAVGAVLGFGVGIPWMFAMTKLQKAQHAYMLTIGILFVIFFLDKSFGGTGALAPLIFGLILGNKQTLSKYLRFKIPEIPSDDSVHNELTFMVRSFFFVFIGLLASITQLEYVFYGVIGAILIYMARIGVVKGILTKRFNKFEKKVTQAMIPRGLAAAVMATVPLTMGLQKGEVYPQIVFVIILTSVIITTIALGRAKKFNIPVTDTTKNNN